MTSGLTNRCDVPALGTSIFTGGTPAAAKHRCARADRSARSVTRSGSCHASSARIGIALAACASGGAFSLFERREESNRRRVGGGSRSDGWLYEVLAVTNSDPQSPMRNSARGFRERVPAARASCSRTTVTTDTASSSQTSPDLRVGWARGRCESSPVPYTSCARHEAIR